MSLISDDVQLKHEGLSVHRLNREPLEKCFADAWEKENERFSNSGSLLAYLLHYDETTGKPYNEPSQEECTKAATVIQWLGSPVGFDFLCQTLESAGYQVVKSNAR